MDSAKNTATMYGIGGSVYGDDELNELHLGWVSIQSVYVFLYG